MNALQLLQLRLQVGSFPHSRSSAPVEQLTLERCRWSQRADYTHDSGAIQLKAKGLHCAGQPECLTGLKGCSGHIAHRSASSLPDCRPCMTLSPFSRRVCSSPTSLLSSSLSLRTLSMRLQQRLRPVTDGHLGAAAGPIAPSHMAYSNCTAITGSLQARSLAESPLQHYNVHAQSVVGAHS